MSRGPRRILMFGVALATLLALPVALVSALPESATMGLGFPDRGSGCNFPCEDDQSFHSVDRFLPGAVAIATDGTVHFEVDGFHQVAIYDAGTVPADIEPDGGSFPFVNDPDGRIFLGGLTANAEYTFESPGKYLVICNITPHFEESQMWGWVIVN